MRSISKTGMWVIALVLLNSLILQNVHADRQFLRPFHNAADRRAARSGGGGGGGGGGSYQSGGGGNCYRPCGKSGGYSQEGSDSAAQKSGGRSGSSSSDSSSKAAEFSTPCTSYTTRIEAGGQTLTLEKVPNQKGQKHQFNAGDTSQSPQEVITQAKTMLNDPSVRVITDSRYPSNIDAQVARADTWKTASGERAGNIPEVTGGGMADVNVRQTLLSSDVQALQFGAMIERMGVTTSPGPENQAKIAEKQAHDTLNALPDDRLEAIKANGENAPSGLEISGPAIAEKILAQRQSARDAEQKALEKKRNDFLNNETQRTDLKNSEMIDARESKAIETGFTKSDGTADLEAFDKAIKEHEKKATASATAKPAQQPAGGTTGTPPAAKPAAPAKPEPPAGGATGTPPAAKPAQLPAPAKPAAPAKPKPPAAPAKPEPPARNWNNWSQIPDLEKQVAKEVSAKWSTWGWSNNGHQGILVTDSSTGNLGRFNFNAYWDKGNNQRQIDIWPAGKQKGDSVPLLRIEAKTGNIIEKFDWVHDGTADYAF